MTDITVEALAASRRLRDDLAGDRLTRATAGLYSEHVRLRAGADTLQGFTEEPRRAQLWNAVRLVEAARFARDRGEPDWRAAYRRAAELLEWLAHPATNPQGLPLELLGAAAYQVAGYPARATSLARLASKESSSGAILRSLLSGDLNAVLLSAARIAAVPADATDHTYESQALDVIAARVAGALGVVAASLRWGADGRLEEALSILEIAPQAARAFVDPFSWLLLRLSGDAARDVTTNALRSALQPLASGLDDQGRAAVERYARGAFLGGQAQVWPSQQRGIDKLIEGGSFALCTPTGSGKTRIAEIALLQSLLTRDEFLSPLCLYVVPTRALAAEVESKLNRAISGATGGTAVTITGLYGGIDWGPADEWLSADEPTVLICTQEKADALLRFFGESVVSRLSVVIIDEAHAIQVTGSNTELERHESRPLRLELLVSRLKAARPDARFIAISAVAQNLAVPLGRWISSETQPEAITVPYRSTRQVIGRLQCHPDGRTRIEYDLLDGSPVRVDDTTESGPFVPSPFPAMPATPGFDGVMKQSAAFAMWAAIHLAAGGEGSEDRQSVLVSVAEQIGNHGSWWLKLLSETWTEAVLPEFFEPPTDAARVDLWRRATDSCRDLFGEASREFQLLERGIVMHHGRMPGRLTRYLSELVEHRVCRVALATSTLSEGINLPFETVLVPGLKRYSTNTRLSGREFANLAGRAGRPGISTEGQTLALLPGSGPSPALRDYRAIIQEILGASESAAPARSAIAALMKHLVSLYPDGDGVDIETWLEVTAPVEIAAIDRTSLTETLDSLDAVLIAALDGVEGDADVEAALRSFWQATFAHYAEADEATLEQLFVSRGLAVTQRVFADARDRTRIYRTSLPPVDAYALFDVVPALVSHLDTGADYAEWANEDRLSYLLRAIELLGDVSRFAVPDRIGASTATREDALRWWFQIQLEGGRTPTISQIAIWHDFLQTELRYRFTWGLGAALALAAESSGSTLDSSPVPSAALWIKDLLTWGTLDPAEAYVLARGLAHTRPEAIEVAELYYADIAADTDGAVGGAIADPHDPARLRLWASRFLASPALRVTPTRFRAEVVDRMNEEARARSYRVVPAHAADAGTQWLDPSGTVLAVSAVGAADIPDPLQFDFELSAPDQVVTASRYA